MFHCLEDKTQLPTMVPEALYKLTCSLSHLIFQFKFFTPSPLLRTLQSWFQCPHPRMLCAARASRLTPLIGTLSPGSTCGLLFQDLTQKSPSLGEL